MLNRSVFFFFSSPPSFEKAAGRRHLWGWWFFFRWGDSVGCSLVRKVFERGFFGNSIIGRGLDLLLLFTFCWFFISFFHLCLSFSYYCPFVLLFFSSLLPLSYFLFPFSLQSIPLRKAASYGLRDCETASATPLTCWGTPPTDSSEFALACLRRKNKWRWVQNGRLWWPWKDRQHKKLDALTVFHRGSTCRWWLGSYQERKTPKMIGVACAYIQISMLDGELSENIRQTYIHIHVHAFIHTYIHYMTMYSYSTRTHG